MSNSKHIQFALLKKSLAKIEKGEEIKNRPPNYKESSKLKVIEQDFLIGDRLHLEDDIYSLTIAAYLSREVSPSLQSNSIRLAGFSFLFEVIVMLGILDDDWKLENIKPFSVKTTSLRIACTLLLQVILFGHLQDSVQLMEFLRRMRSSKRNWR